MTGGICINNPGASKELFPPMLDACTDSRKIAQAVYTCLPYVSHPDLRPNSGSILGRNPIIPQGYFNTLFDSFYIGGFNNEWSHFTLLVDIVIQLNSTRPLHPRVQEQVWEWKKIRHLMVDLTVFGGAPTRIWAEFRSL